MVFSGVALLALLAVGVPIAIALGAVSLIYLLFFTPLDLVAIGQSLFFFLNSYTLMAIPFFVTAGFLMERAGLIGDIFDFSQALLGWLPGGLGVAAVFTCVIFASISGSSAAMAATMSLIAIPAMVERGFPRAVAAGIVAAGGGIGLLIPPSLAFILYGIATETSIVRLFLAGIIPGLALAVGMVIVVVVTAAILKLPTEPFEVRRLLRTGRQALPALGMPVVVLGGLYGGVFTPTEAGAVAVGYAMVIGLLVRRKAFLVQVIPATKNAINITTMIFFILGSVGMFQFVAANQYWPQSIAGQLTALELSPLVFIFGFTLVLLFLGMFLDGVALILLTVPITFPAAMAIGVDPLHLGVIMALMIELAVVTPPVGFNLYAVSGVGKIPIPTVVRGTAPYFAMDVLVLIFVVFFPEMSTWLPSLT